MGDWRSKIKKYHSYKPDKKKDSKKDSKKSTPAKKKESIVERLLRSRRSRTRTPKAPPPTNVPNYADFGRAKQPQSIAPKYSSGKGSTNRTSKKPAVPNYADFGRARQPQSIAPRYGYSSEAKAQLRNISPLSPTRQTIYTPQSQPRGWSNVWDVAKIALNPFSKEKILANIDHSVFKTGAEYIANNPYSTALFLTGITSAVKGGISIAKSTGRFIPGKIVQTTLTGGPGFVVNTKTATQSASMIANILAQAKKPAYVLGAIGGMIGTYPWSEWALGEAKEGMIFNMQKAVNTGDPDIINMFKETAEEIFDQSIWENIARLTPGANIFYSFKKKAEALAAQKKVNDAILNNTLIQIETGETDNEMYKRIEEERQEKKVLERQADEEYYAEIDRKKAEAKAEERKADEEYWDNILSGKDEEVKKKKNYDNDYWNAYYKTMQKIRDNNTKSNLNFGLL